MEVNKELISYIKASELPKVGNPVSGDLIHAQGDNLSATPISYFIDKISSGIYGRLTTSTVVPVTGYYKYDVFNVGTYTNVTPNITITQQELDENFVFVTVNNGVAYKATSKKPKSDIDKKFDINSNNTISNGRTSTLALVLDYFMKPTILRGIEIINYGMQGIINVDGTIISTDEAYRYQKIDILQGEKSVYFKGYMPVTIAGNNNQKIYPTILAGNVAGDLTCIMESMPNNIADPLIIREGYADIPEGSIFIYVVWQKMALNVPTINTLVNDKDVKKNSVKEYIDEKTSENTPIPNIVSVGISKYTDFNDPTLLNGRIVQGGIFENGYPGDKTGMVLIPTGAKYICACKLSTTGFIQFADNSPNRISGAVSSTKNIKIPTNATRVYFTARRENAFKVDFAKDTFEFNLNENTKVINTGTLQQAIIDTNNSGAIMLSENLYTFEGDDLRLYTESLFSGFMPKQNYNIEFIGNDVIGTNGAKGNWVFANNPGFLSVNVFDLNRTKIAFKTTRINKKYFPSSITKLPAGNAKLPILVIGDSLWHNNRNKIGEEWLRMLNTNQEAYNDGDLYYKKTYNLGLGKLQLVGSQGGEENKYTIANSLELIMTSTVPYNEGTSGNPFYNPDSTQPNELDADGINKKIDFAWYFQQICGQGKYPKYIYFACGVNDILTLGWNIDHLPFIQDRLRIVLYRMKKACDAIAGGTSDVKILMVNHQFYPLNEGYTFEDTFSCARQRRLWTEHYTAYERIINTETFRDLKFSDYVRFVDCASSFDVDNGYEYDQFTENPRSTKIVNTIKDVVHMGTKGSLMYADGLIRDFLYHECQ
ncbi:hypothetical protein M2T78_19120 [Elizabethkingia ursingii]|uniref:hypothetical protein n=1 Tax=Elizabethkingia ursingii TaxID=1756150 RepID=UPI002012241E|nr:hypothetical protein [Elizabethkingia ursingii]MCL1666382.1 hypothetical protein [Elizabethkingia ursingii]